MAHVHDTGGQRDGAVRDPTEETVSQPNRNLLRRLFEVRQDKRLEEQAPCSRVGRSLKHGQDRVRSAVLPDVIEDPERPRSGHYGWVESHLRKDRDGGLAEETQALPRPMLRQVPLVCGPQDWEPTAVMKGSQGSSRLIRHLRVNGEVAPAEGEDGVVSECTESPQGGLADLECRIAKRLTQAGGRHGILQKHQSHHGPAPLVLLFVEPDDAGQPLLYLPLRSLQLPQFGLAEETRMREPRIRRLRFASEVFNQLDSRGDSQLTGAVRPRVRFSGVVGGQPFDRPVNCESLVGEGWLPGAHGFWGQPQPVILVWEGWLGVADGRE